MKKIAITGGLSCGKSTACRVFRELGAYVVSADEIVHKLLSPETSLGQKVVNLLGPTILVNGQIDRRKIAERVFNDRKRLVALEDLVHPVVREEVTRHFNEVNAQGSHELFVAEIPLLFEGSYQNFYDYTIAVVADETICRQRFRESSGHDDSEFTRRMNRQLPISEKAKRADFVINNSGHTQELRESVRKLYSHLLTAPTRTSNGGA